MSLFINYLSMRGENDSLLNYEYELGSGELKALSEFVRVGPDVNGS